MLARCVLGKSRGLTFCIGEGFLQAQPFPFVGSLRRLLTRGDIGFAEGYLEGDWTTPDLVQVFAWAHANEAALAPAWKGTLLQRFADRDPCLSRLWPS